MSKIGCDLVDIARIEEKIKNDVFVKKVFSENEILLFKSRNFKAETVAGNFAGKEAFVKAVGSGFGSIRPNEIEVLRKENGCPYILYNKREYPVSISHENGFAFAVVVLD